jgi:copper oxidase (laccase) domain-containing protein
MTGNWSLKGDTPEEAEANNPGILAKIAQLAEECGCRIFAPVPTTFTAEICRKEDLADEWLRGVLYRGKYADGVALDKMGDAFGLASADCLTAVMRDPKSGLVVAAHAGRDSLVDRRVIRGGRARRHDSVIHSMVTPFIAHPCATKTDLRAFLACGIGARNFGHEWNHPVHGRDNRRLVNNLVSRYGPEVVMPPRYLGRISLVGLARIQCEMSGIGWGRIGCDATDTYADRDSYGIPLWHSHRRDGDGKRNLVLVIRRF